jgi:hypothetical protein
MNAPAEIKFVGFPDGQSVFVPEFGCHVGTFTLAPGDNKPAIMHHVPLEYRGDYRPTELANYDAEYDYRTDDYGKLLCDGTTLARSICNRKAVNRSRFCNAHGGRLHPLDKLVKDVEPEEISLTRYQQFKAGQIGVDDLDDEELATCGFRSTDGRIYKPRNIPREMAQAFQKAIFERANQQLKSLVVDAANTIGEIMKDKHVEPDIRLKAALSLVERNLGKTPQVVAITDAKAYEEIFDDIIHVKSERPKALDANTIEGEIVVEPTTTERDQSVNEPGGNFDRAFGDTDEGSSGIGFADAVDGGYNPQSGDIVSGVRRGSERNEAVLAQVVEIKPFEYDLSDKREEIKKATRKRYATKAFGTSSAMPPIPYTVIEEKIGNGLVNIRFIEPAMPKVPKPKKSDIKRKSFTLSDFG